MADVRNVVDEEEEDEIPWIKNIVSIRALTIAKSRLYMILFTEPDCCGNQSRLCVKEPQSATQPVRHSHVKLTPEFIVQ